MKPKALGDTNITTGTVTIIQTPTDADAPSTPTDSDGPGGRSTGGSFDQRRQEIKQPPLRGSDHRDRGVRKL